MSCLGKVLEAVIREKFSHHLSEILPQNLYSFPPGKSTGDAIVAITLSTPRTMLPSLNRNEKAEDKIYWPQSWVNPISSPCPLVVLLTFLNLAIVSISSVK